MAFPSHCRFWFFLGCKKNIPALAPAVCPVAHLQRTKVPPPGEMFEQTAQGLQEVSVSVLVHLSGEFPIYKRARACRMDIAKS